MDLSNILILAGAIALAILLTVVVRLRQRSHAEHARQTADDVICPHLRPAWEVLQSRGHRARRVGQRHPDLPMEIHVTPPFDPQSIHNELKLTDPVFVSERNVLYCKEDWCEIHPAA